MSITRRSLIAAAATTAIGLPRARAQRPVVRVGVMNDMSGPYRDVNGPTGVACARQAIQEFNPGGFEIELLSADHQNKPDVAVSLARNWFDQRGVDVIVDVAASSCALALYSVFRE
jgi:branched-chain amino acid transport system substrate-binding protein